MSPHNQHLQGSNRKHRQTVRTIPVNKKHRYSGEAEEPWHGPHKPAPWKPWTAKRRLLAESRVRPSPKGWLRHTKQEDGMETGNPVQKYCFLSIKKPVTSVMWFFTNATFWKQKWNYLLMIDKFCMSEYD